jgi:hypothetical protein
MFFVLLSIIKRKTMKRLLIMALSVMLVAGASAQRHGGGGFIGGGGYRGGGSRVIVTGGLGLGLYPYYGGFYDPFYAYPPGYYGYSGRPSRLSMKIEDIKIYSVRQDNTLTGKERRQKVRELKHDRDQAIEDLKSNYYKKD